MRMVNLSRAIRSGNTARMVWGVDETGDEFILTPYWFLKIVGRFPNEIVKTLLPYFTSRPMSEGSQVRSFPDDGDSVITNASKLIQGFLDAPSFAMAVRTGLSQGRLEIISTISRGYFYYDIDFMGIIPDKTTLKIDSGAKMPMLISHFTDDVNYQKHIFTFGVLPFDVKEPNQYLKEDFSK